MKKINKEMVQWILADMPQEKKQALDKACYRNLLMTSEYGLENGTLTVYKEGWYLELEGCRSRFAVWAGDNDGELVFRRKPAESKLNKLYSEWFKTWEAVDSFAKVTA